MNAFKKLAVVGAFTFASFLPIGNEPTVQADPPAGHSHTRIYWVYYRTCPHSPWVCYGGYYSPQTSQQAANAIRGYGYESFVR